MLFRSQIVQGQLCVADLGYKGDEGQVSGEGVIRDIIDQGSRLASEKRQQEKEIEENKQIKGEPDEQVIRTTYYL